MTETKNKRNLFIASPLEREYVRRLAEVAPDDVEIIYEPDLLPPTRFVADHKGVEGFRHTREQAQRWRSHFSKAEILLDFPSVPVEGANGIDLAEKLKWVQTTSSGVGQMIVKLGLQNFDLRITTARGVHAAPLAEYVFMTLLNHAKQLKHLESEQRLHHWERYCSDELYGKTLGIVGAGEIGRRIAKIAHSFDMKVVALASPGSSRTAGELGVDELYPNTQLQSMLSKCDVLVLSIPHTPETEGLIDKAALASLKPGGILINIARGQVIDQVALIEALQSGHLAFAALDVFAVEPLPADSPLWDMPNVLISPHSASTSTSENSKITDIFCYNLRCYVDGRIDDMRNILDKIRMY